jgi:hypothetical protein
MPEPYSRLREWHENISGSFDVLAATDDTVLVASRGPEYTIFIQKIHVRITGASAGKTWSLEDTNSPADSLSGLLPTDVALVVSELDFGARGMPVGQGKGLSLNVSAVGAAGHISWEGYQRPTATLHL